MVVNVPLGLKHPSSASEQRIGPNLVLLLQEEQPVYLVESTTYSPQELHFWKVPVNVLLKH